jgi:hypothetical protein
VSEPKLDTTPWRGRNVLAAGVDLQEFFASHPGDPRDFVYAVVTVNGQLHKCRPGGQWEPPFPDDDPQPDHIIVKE